MNSLKNVLRTLYDCADLYDIGCNSLLFESKKTSYTKFSKLTLMCKSVKHITIHLNFFVNHTTPSIS